MRRRLLLFALAVCADLPWLTSCQSGWSRSDENSKNLLREHLLTNYSHQTPAPGAGQLASMLSQSWPAGRAAGNLTGQGCEC